MTSETDANDAAQAQINVSEIPVVGCSSSPTLMLVGRELGEMQMRRKLANTELRPRRDSIVRRCGETRRDDTRISLVPCFLIPMLLLSPFLLVRGDG